MLEELKAKVCQANLDLVKHGLVIFTWGNVSAIDREKGLVVIKPSGVDYDDMKPWDMVVVDLDGKIVEGDLRPSSDTATHLEIYKAFPEVGGIVHTHSTYATAWAQAGKDIPNIGTTHADTFHDDVPVTGEIPSDRIRDAYEEASPVRTIIDSAEQKIFDISNNSDVKEFRHIRDILQNVYRDIETTVEMKGAVTGAKTGFSGLDRMLVQMGKGDLVIVGARPGMGKTSFALNIARNVAVNGGKRVCFFSLEMSRDQLAQHLLSNEAAIESSHLRDSQLMTKDEWERLAHAAEQLSKTDMYLDETEISRNLDAALNWILTKETEVVK